MAGRNPRPPTIAERNERNAAAPEQEIKKWKNLSYGEKQEIIKMIDGGATKRRKFGINESTV